ncbi:hypothetical protein Dimus_009857 [Dionaea muscipula]
MVDLNGNEDSAGDGYISMYLKLVDELKPGEVVNAMFRFFVYNQKRDNYFTKQDMIGKRFSLLKPEWGIRKVLSLSTFNNPTKGYVIDDCCVFGAEVFVLENDSRVETLSLIKDAVNYQYSWTVSKYSKLNDQYCMSSPAFSFDGISWTLLLYPRGNGREEGKSISIFLRMLDHSNLSIDEEKVFVDYEITLKDQLGSQDVKKCDAAWFQADGGAWGYPAFLSLSDLKNPSKGYLLMDKLIIELDVKTMFRLENV